MSDCNHPACVNFRISLLIETYELRHEISARTEKLIAQLGGIVTDRAGISAVDAPTAANTSIAGPLISSSPLRPSSPVLWSTTDARKAGSVSTASCSAAAAQQQQPQPTNASHIDLGLRWSGDDYGVDAEVNKSVANKMFLKKRRGSIPTATEESRSYIDGIASILPQGLIRAATMKAPKSIINLTTSRGTLKDAALSEKRREDSEYRKFQDHVQLHHGGSAGMGSGLSLRNLMFPARTSLGNSQSPTTFQNYIHQHARNASITSQSRNNYRSRRTSNTSSKNQKNSFLSQHQQQLSQQQQPSSSKGSATNHIIKSSSLYGSQSSYASSIPNESADSISHADRYGDIAPDYMIRSAESIDRRFDGAPQVPVIPAHYSLDTINSNDAPSVSDLDSNASHRNSTNQAPEPSKITQAAALRLSELKTLKSKRHDAVNGLARTSVDRHKSLISPKIKLVASASQNASVESVAVQNSSNRRIDAESKDQSVERSNSLSKNVRMRSYTEDQIASTIPFSDYQKREAQAAAAAVSIIVPETDVHNNAKISLTRRIYQAWFIMFLFPAFDQKGRKLTADQFDETDFESINFFVNGIHPKSYFSTLWDAIIACRSFARSLSFGR
ncbi:hypothetical protein HDU84_000122 [Entophlyctis sp. JEL0112]|nr:hypothetical protein HDU84_000122 [Entophlyctis sp. JEL0112]